MATIVAHHKVKDFHTWKPFYEQDLERRKALGLTDISIGRKIDDPNEVYLIWKINNPEKIKTLTTDPEMKKVMEKAGVISELKVDAILLDD
jgi:hypothetical protein